MEYKIGDKVIHTSFGFAEIVGLEEKEIAGKFDRYYVVKTNKMLVWIPVSHIEKVTLRFPSSKMVFDELFSILRSKVSAFSADRMIRKSEIFSRINEGNSESICRLVRDMSFYRTTKKFNEYEKSMFDRAIRVLMDEWQFSLNITPAQARIDLDGMLAESYSASVIP
jgi:CarD family transcriptional regulator